MTLDTARRVAAWIEGQLDQVQPETVTLTFFGGEPLLNLPVVYELAERVWTATARRNIPITLTIITNGLLLTPEIVDRLKPYGLKGVKVTLDGDREYHDAMRHLRGGQKTFDRIIENLRRIAGRVSIAIGGNFTEDSFDGIPALLDFLKNQDFASSIGKVRFNPIVRAEQPGHNRVIPLTAIPIHGGTVTSVASAHQNHPPCGTCGFLDEKMMFLQEETRKRGFESPSWLLGAPCRVHQSHSHTIGPDGSLYACPGFTGDRALPIGHIDGTADTDRVATCEKRDRLAPWRQCGDCAYIPVCAGGCQVESHMRSGVFDAPSCHKTGFEAALLSLARETLAAS
jgi:uncharacterized protein